MYQGDFRPKVCAEFMIKSEAVVTFRFTLAIFDFRSVNDDISTKIIMTTLMYGGYFKLKVQAEIRSKTIVTLMYMDDPKF